VLLLELPELGVDLKGALEVRLPVAARWRQVAKTRKELLRLFQQVLELYPCMSFELWAIFC
jgi:hypothetical protein